MADVIREIRKIHDPNNTTNSSTYYIGTRAEYVKITDPFTGSTTNSLSQFLSTAINGGLKQRVVFGNPNNSTVSSSQALAPGLVPAFPTTQADKVFSNPQVNPSNTSELKGTYSKYWLNGSGTWLQMPLFSSADNGLVPNSATTVSTMASTNVYFLNSSGKWQRINDTTYPIYTTKITNGGLVPSSATITTARASTADYFLSRSGKWQLPAYPEVYDPDNKKYIGLVSQSAAKEKDPGSSITKFLNSSGKWQTPHDTTYQIYTKSVTNGGLVPSSATTVSAVGASTTRFLNSDGKWQIPLNTTYPVYGGGNTNGLVPGYSSATRVAAATARTYFLNKDGEWQVPFYTTYAVASTNASGLMSKTDKAKLDKIGNQGWALITPTKPAGENLKYFKYNTLQTLDLQKYDEFEINVQVDRMAIQDGGETKYPAVYVNFHVNKMMLAGFSTWFLVNYWPTTSGNGYIRLFFNSTSSTKAQVKIASVYSSGTINYKDNVQGWLFGRKTGD